MAWKTDTKGLVFDPKEVKLYKDGKATWAMKLSQLRKQQGVVRIVTYSLPNLQYIGKMFGKRPYHIYLLAHSQFARKAYAIRQAYPGIQIALHKEVHSKVCLIAPETVYIGSANFGNSKWHESIVGIRSKEAHDWYVENSFMSLWKIARKI